MVVFCPGTQARVTDRPGFERTTLGSSVRLANHSATASNDVDVVYSIAQLGCSVMVYSNLFSLLLFQGVQKLSTNEVDVDDVDVDVVCELWVILNFVDAPR